MHLWTKKCGSIDTNGNALVAAKNIRLLVGTMLVIGVVSAPNTVKALRAYKSRDPVELTAVC